jgi:hypothetical protein
MALPRPAPEQKRKVASAARLGLVPIDRQRRPRSSLCVLYLSEPPLTDPHFVRKLLLRCAALTA